MKGFILLEYSDTAERIEYLFEDSFDETNDYLIGITIPTGRKVNYNQIKLGLNKYFLRKLNGKQYQKDFPERVEMLRKAFDEGIDLFDNCDLIKTDYVDKDFLDQIPNINDKKIVVKTKPYPLTMEGVEEAENLYQGYDRIYIKVEENDDKVLLSEYRKTVEILDEVVNKIKSYNLSPLEAVIYAYDYARDKVYVYEDHNDRYTESRDLTNVLLRNKIVCVGYARIFAAILNKLGIKTARYTVDGKTESHAIDIVHIKDDKYDIDQICYFDPTLDRKRDQTNNHFNRYRAFGLSRGQYLRLTDQEDETFGPSEFEYYKDIVRTLKRGQPKYGLYKELRYIHNMNSFIEGKPLDTDIHSLGSNYRQEIIDNPNTIENIDECLRLMDQYLEPEKILEAFLKVRKIRYYEDPEKYPLSAKRIKEIANMSAWICNDYYWSPDVMYKYIQEHQEEYELETKRVDLVKVLRKVKEQKEND